MISVRGKHRRVALRHRQHPPGIFASSPFYFRVRIHVLLDRESNFDVAAFLNTAVRHAKWITVYLALPRLAWKGRRGWKVWRVIWRGTRILDSEFGINSFSGSRRMHRLERDIGFIHVIFVPIYERLSIFLQRYSYFYLYHRLKNYSKLN